MKGDGVRVDDLVRNEILWTQRIRELTASAAISIFAPWMQGILPLRQGLRETATGTCQPLALYIPSQDLNSPRRENYGQRRYIDEPSSSLQARQGGMAARSFLKRLLII